MISNISIATHAMYYNPSIVNNLIANTNHKNNDKKNEDKILSNREVLSTKEKLKRLNQQLYTPFSISSMILKSKFANEDNSDDRIS